ncbi:MAG: nitrite/sulfite reductase [Polyangiaceae bacterium]
MSSAGVVPSSVASDAFVPRFASQADVDEFVQVLEQFEKNELSPDAWRKFRLVRGLYGQRQEGVQMLRIKIPLGHLVASQARVVADIAEAHAHGRAHLTTRQNFQFHFIQLAEVASIMTTLVDAGITTREACGNSVRTVTGCDLAGVAKSAVFDTRAHGEAITRFFLRHPKAAGLPRKFKIAVSCCPHDCAQAAIHDVGLVAKIVDGQRGFRVLVGGGLSTSPEAAAVLYEFLPEHAILELCEAVLMVFDARGNRENKHRARLKYVLRAVGLDELRRLVDVEREKIRERGDAPVVLSATPLPSPPKREAPSPSLPPEPGYLTWLSSNVIEQSQEGYASVVIRLPLGDVTSEQLRVVADAAERFGDGTIWTSSQQNLLLRFVPRGETRAVHAFLRERGLARDGANSIVDITSCPGADSCNLAVTTSRGLGAALGAALENALAQGGAQAEAVKLASDASIKISGCPHSCGRHHIADLGFHGAARKIGGRTMPMYQLHVGGGVDEQGARFGSQPVKIPAKRAPQAVLALIEFFAAQRTGGESFGSFLRRISVNELKAAIARFTDIDPSVAVDDEYADYGAQSGFVVETKSGECAA